MSQPGTEPGSVSERDRSPVPDAPAPAPSPGGPAAAASTPAVPETLALLETLAERPLSEHPDVYQRAHSRLQQALTEIDDA